MSRLLREKSPLLDTQQRCSSRLLVRLSLTVRVVAVAVCVERLEYFRLGWYLVVPVACVWLYNVPSINKYIEDRVSAPHTPLSHTHTSTSTLSAAAAL